jgi:hypothetical protein
MTGKSEAVNTHSHKYYPIRPTHTLVVSQQRYGEGGKAIAHKESCPPLALPLLLWRCSGSQKFFVQYRSPHIKDVNFFRVCLMSCRSHSSKLNQSNNFTWRVQIMKLLITIMFFFSVNCYALFLHYHYVFFPVLCYVLFLRSKNFPQQFSIAPSHPYKTNKLNTQLQFHILEYFPFIFKQKGFCDKSNAVNFRKWRQSSNSIAPCRQ